MVLSTRPLLGACWLSLALLGHLVAGLARKKLQARTVAQLPKPVGWFGSFSEGESTWTEGGVLSHPDNPEFYVQYGGKDPALPDQKMNDVVMESEYFHESESAVETAWQTHNPAVQGSIAGNRQIRNGKWMYTPNGWVQNYVTQDNNPLTYTGNMPKKRPGEKEAPFFENEVQQYDGFGRFRFPKRDSAYFLSDKGWKERSVNTTLKCKDPGCIANVSIQAFDGAKEEARNCRLSLNVHPTDYDDEWSKEVIEYFKVNGAVASRDCNPKARGCNETAMKPLFPCLKEFDVDDAIDEAGTLVVEGKISYWVDECPHEDNLLSSIVTVTCMVRPPPTLLLESTTTTTTTTTTLRAMTASAPLQCDEPGCIARSRLIFRPALALHGGKCLMSVNVTQTDFDDKMGLAEDVEYIAVSGVNVTKEPLSPGKNPCKAEFEGKPLTDDEKVFTVLKDYDVTDMILQTRPIGTLYISGKISRAVDECGSNGNLLDGTVFLECTPPGDKKDAKES
mmetsp:Transcript_5744/g.9743  ORF Transcript_5744/g.9743 Transcript_5744/m.9743 type:complete len:506 (+) Transcript_5744:51-1568(+)